MQPSENAYTLVKNAEGCKLVCYADPATGKPTIGWGHTATLLPNDVDEKKITQEQADQLLAADMLICGANWVNKYVTVELNQNQFDALCDFCYNEGNYRLLTSTLLHLINQSDFDNAANEFGKWIYGLVNGRYQVMNGLVARREAERQLFVS